MVIFEPPSSRILTGSLQSMRKCRMVVCKNLKIDRSRDCVVRFSSTIPLCDPLVILDPMTSRNPTKTSCSLSKARETENQPICVIFDLQNGITHERLHIFRPGFGLDCLASRDRSNGTGRIELAPLQPALWLETAP